jgi:hypothetical protein
VTWKVIFCVSFESRARRAIPLRRAARANRGMIVLSAGNGQRAIARKSSSTAPATLVRNVMAQQHRWFSGEGVQT